MPTAFPNVQRHPVLYRRWEGFSSEHWSSIAVVTATKLPTQKRHTQFGCGSACGDRSASFRAPEGTVHSSDRYLIEIKDTETGEVLMCEAVDWTDEQRRFFIAHVLRLAGIPAAGDEPEQGSGPLQ